MTRITPTFAQQASRAFGQLVRSITDAQLRALMRAVFYHAGRYEAFCQAPLALTGADAAAGSAVRHAIRTGRLLRAVAGSFSPASRDLMMAAALLMSAGAAEAFDTQGAVRLTSRGRLYPVNMLSALMVHDARCSIDRAKRESLEGLILRAAWYAGEEGAPSPHEHGSECLLQREAQVVAICMQLDRFAAGQSGERVALPRPTAVRWSGQTARHLTLVDPLRKEHDDNTTEPRIATG